MNYNEHLPRWEHLAEEDLPRWLDPTITLIKVVASPNPFNDEENSSAWNCVRQDLQDDTRYSALFRLHLRKNPVLYSGVNWHRTVVHPGLGRLVQLVVLGQSIGGLERYLHRYTRDQIWYTDKVEKTLNRVTQLCRYFVDQPLLLGEIARSAPDATVPGWVDLVLRHAPERYDATSWLSYLALHDTAVACEQVSVVASAEAEQFQRKFVAAFPADPPEVMRIDYAREERKFLEYLGTHTGRADGSAPDQTNIPKTAVPVSPTGRLTPAEPEIQTIPTKKAKFAGSGKDVGRAVAEVPHRPKAGLPSCSFGRHFALLLDEVYPAHIHGMKEHAADPSWYLNRCTASYDKGGQIEYSAQFDLTKLPACTEHLPNGKVCGLESVTATVTYSGRNKLRFSYYCNGDGCPCAPESAESLRMFCTAPDLVTSYDFAAWLAAQLRSRLDHSVHTTSKPDQIKSESPVTTRYGFTALQLLLDEAPGHTLKDSGTPIHWEITDYGYTRGIAYPDERYVGFRLYDLLPCGNLTKHAENCTSCDVAATVRYQDGKVTYSYCCANPRCNHISSRSKPLRVSLDKHVSARGFAVQLARLLRQHVVKDRR